MVKSIDVHILCSPEFDLNLQGQTVFAVAVVGLVATFAAVVVVAVEPEASAVAVVGSENLKISYQALRPMPRSHRKRAKKLTHEGRYRCSYSTPAHSE